MIPRWALSLTLLVGCIRSPVPHRVARRDATRPCTLASIDATAAPPVVASPRADASPAARIATMPRPCPVGAETGPGVVEIEHFPAPGSLLRGAESFAFPSSIPDVRWSVLARTPFGQVGGGRLSAVQLTLVDGDYGGEGGALFLVRRVARGDCVLAAWGLREGGDGDAISLDAHWISADRSVAVLVVHSTSFMHGTEDLESVSVWATDGARTWRAVPVGVADHAAIPQLIADPLRPRLAFAMRAGHPPARFVWDADARRFVATLR